MPTIYQNVHLTLIEVDNGRRQVERKIDVTNLTGGGMVPLNVWPRQGTGSDESHYTKKLLEWIKERGEPQHNSRLVLRKWYLTA